LKRKNRDARMKNDASIKKGATFAEAMALQVGDIY
jgi:hypothetical protein